MWVGRYSQGRSLAGTKRPSNRVSKGKVSCEKKARARNGLPIGSRCAHGQNISISAKPIAATGSSTRHKLVHPAAIAADSRRATTP